MTVNVKRLLKYLVITLGTGALSALASGGFEKYADLKKPPLSPPDAVFPVVWTVLYVLMAVSAYVISGSTEIGERSKALTVFYIQLAVNFMWSVIFFRFGLFGAAAVWLFMLIIWIISMLREFAKLDKTAARLQIFYLIWCIFALYLNIGVFILNK